MLDVYEAGLRNDPRYHAAHYDYQAAMQKIPQARAELMPQLSFDARQSRTEQNILEREQPVFGIGRSRFTTRTWQFQVSQPLFRYSSWVQLSQSRAVVRQAFAVYTAAEQELILRAAALYLNLLASQDRVSLSEAELAAVGRQLELVQAQRRGGLAAITDEYEAEARFSFVQADLIEATYALDDAYQALRELAGDAVSSVYPLYPEIPLLPPQPADLGEWVARAVDQNLLLMARNAAVEVAEHEAKRVRASHYPSLELVASTGNTDVGGAVTGGASNTDTNVIGVQFNMPVFSGGVVLARAREADMTLNRVKQERVLQHRVVMRETRGAYQGVISAIQRVRALEASLTSQESAVEGRTRGFRSGVYTLLDVLDSERELFQTRRDLARARYEYLLNLLQLKRQAGTLSEEDLVYLNDLLDRNQTLMLTAE
ncbi:MAG: TolC family outer membrane protein [Gammaproteobacteria bacterium]